jgi:hypothetical protein
MSTDRQGLLQQGNLRGLYSASLCLTWTLTKKIIYHLIASGHFEPWPYLLIASTKTVWLSRISISSSSGKPCFLVGESFFIGDVTRKKKSDSPDVSVWVGWKNKTSQGKMRAHIMPCCCKLGRMSMKHRPPYVAYCNVTTTSSFFCNNFHHGERIQPPAYAGEPMYANHSRWGVCLLLGKTLQEGVEVVRSPNQGDGVRRTVEKVKAKKTLSTLIKNLALHRSCVIYIVLLVYSLSLRNSVHIVLYRRQPCAVGSWKRGFSMWTLVRWRTLNERKAIAVNKAVHWLSIMAGWVSQILSLFVLAKNALTILMRGITVRILPL